jgi:hypothetical protein
MPLSRRARIALRIGLVLIGAAALSWSATVMRGLRDADELSAISDMILFGQNVPLQSLAPVLAYLDRNDVGTCLRAVSSAAAIRFYVAASAQEAGGPLFTQRLQEARRALRQALTCAPHQSYLWYGLFWIEMARETSPDVYLAYLAKSYELAPNEGWIARFRAPDALPHYDKLPTRVQEQVRSEFLNLVRDDPPVAASAFRDADQRARARLLAWIGEAPIAQRRRLAALLDERNVLVDLPGVEYQQGRAVTEPKKKQN